MRLTHSFSSFKQFKNCPLSYYRQRVIKDVKSKSGPEADEGERQHKGLENRIAFNAPLPDDMQGLEPMCAAIDKVTRGCSIIPEREFVLTDELTPTGWWDDDAWFRSKADVFVLNNGETRAVILDWKTGKRRPDFLQMELMAMAAMIYYPKLMRVDTMFVWLKTKEQDSMTYRRSQFPSLVETLLTNVTRIEMAVENDRWPAKPSGLCPWCPAHDTCRWA